jgi:hypothetical protein
MQTMNEYYQQTFIGLIRMNPYGPGAQTRLKELEKASYEDASFIKEETDGKATITYTLLYHALYGSVANNQGDQLYEHIQAGLLGKLLAFRAVREEFPALSTPSDLAALLTPFQAMKRKLELCLDSWHDGELYHFAYADFLRALLDAVKQRRKDHFAAIEARCNKIKEELISAAWHPTRVERWLAAGVELEAL